MNKIKLNPQPLLYPVPVVLVGAIINEKPNFMTAAWCGVACSEPPMISVAIRPSRYTLKGIRDNMAFSINVPSISQVNETDYCGIESGLNSNKTDHCRFQVFYDQPVGAPLIEQCPINLACSVAHILDLGSHFLVIGKIETTFVSAECLPDGKLDVDKIKPFAFVMGPTGQYRMLGELVGKPFSAGLELKQTR